MNFRGGFTLFELIIVIALFAIAASVVVFGISGQRSTVGLDSEAESVVLLIEESKSRARTASDQILAGSLTASDYRGVYFGSTSGVFDTTLLGFIDLSSEGTVGRYEGRDVIFDQASLDSAAITQVCGGDVQVDGSLSWTCVSSADTDGVHIAFRRSYEQSPSIWVNGTGYEAVRIDLESGPETQYVYVDTNGSSFTSGTLVSI